MPAIKIYTPDSKTKHSAIFSVVKDRVIVVSGFNFACATTDEFGEVINRAQRAILHKVTLAGGDLPYCTDLCGCVIEAKSAHIESSEPVVSCGCAWSLHGADNLVVLSVPGYYKFELCDESAIGKVSIEIEELTLEQAKLIPANLFIGA